MFDVCNTEPVGAVYTGYRSPADMLRNLQTVGKPENGVYVYS